MQHRPIVFVTLFTCFLASRMALAAGDPGGAGWCPTLADANKRLQARAEFLIDQVQKVLSSTDPRTNRTYLATIQGDGTTPDLYVALAAIIATRAKEEARLWLVEKLSDDICDPKHTGFSYFPNVCSAVKNSGEYPGASLGLIKTRLRQDIYALPACALYPKNAFNDASIFVDVAASDVAIDSYVLEAGLLAVYLLSKDGKELDPDAPSLGTLPDKTQLAKLLAGAAIAKFTGPDLNANFISAICQPTNDQIAALIAALKNRLNSSVATDRTIEAVLKELYTQLKPWCPDGADQLKLVGDIYLTTVRGDYYEAAFAAASTFLCNQQTEVEKKKAAPICSKLPLLAEVASAKTQDDMEAALDRVIAPLGAWKRKQSERVFSLNAMAGIAAGEERLEDAGASAEHSTYGLYMPIAVEYSFPKRLLWFESIALGLTALDLGGVVSYSEKDELGGGETSTAANTAWSSLTSPGAYVAFAFRDSPFRIGISYSKTPELRSVDFSDGTERDVDSERLMLFVTVDVTLLTF